jgi:hypothetical protein
MVTNKAASRIKMGTNLCHEFSRIDTKSETYWTVLQLIVSR